MVENNVIVANNAANESILASVVKLQTEVSEETKTALRIEALRRHTTMGRLLDEMVKKFLLGVGDGVSKTTS
jgi:hypothetical protein